MAFAPEQGGDPAFDASREHVVVSPVTGQAIGRVPLASSTEIARVLAERGGPPSVPARSDVLEFLRDRAAQYDLLIARDLFEHLTKEDALEGLTLCREALRPGGALLLQVPNGESPFAGRIIYGDFTHETAFTQTSLNQVLRAAGFDSVMCHPVRPVVYGLKSWLRSLVWRVVEAAIITAVVAEVGTEPVTDVYDELVPGSRNGGQVDLADLLAGRPQTAVRNPDGTYQLFRIGDALASRNVHAAMLDAARLCRRI